MCNLAVKIIYSLLNSLETVACERVFAPAQDFEAALRTADLPLCSLESAIPLREFDFLCFSIGYELTLTNMLNILDLGGIAPKREDRQDGDPIVIAGGPGILNPAPIGLFVDCVYIGEAEAWVRQLFSEMAVKKTGGAARKALVDYLLCQTFIWAADKKERCQKAVWQGFGHTEVLPSFPVPNIRTVQDHGVVEIMRGCPTGCRFCLAGMYYRPYRMKSPELVALETEHLVRAHGYREITLASLSSGDYRGIAELIKALNNRYNALNVSFALPSLKVTSLGLSILAQLSKVRKSGLTFAVETPEPEWQMAINKSTALQKIIDILMQAKTLGWRRVKFYFMVGLPVSADKDEAGPIAEFLRVVQKTTGMQLHANIACFIPKPHTPFQWARQINETEGMDKIMLLKRNLGSKKIKINYHSPFVSMLEGLISRGDARVGSIILEAFNRGARFDAWEEHIDTKLWKSVIEDAGWNVFGETLGSRELDATLPWDGVNLGVKRSFLAGELEKSRLQNTSAGCSGQCTSSCGVCRGETRVDESGNRNGKNLAPLVISHKAKQRVLISLAKNGKSIYCSHLDTLQMLERSLQRADYQPQFSEGFNPKPRIEFANPLSLGIASDGEVIGVELLNYDSQEQFRNRLNACLPAGFKVVRSKILRSKNKKKKSLMSLYWGSDFQIDCRGNTELRSELDKLIQGPQIESWLESAGGPASSLALIGDGVLQVRIRRIERKGANVLKFLTALFECTPFETGVLIRRNVLWAGYGQPGGPAFRYGQPGSATGRSGVPVRPTGMISYFDYQF